MIKAKLTFTIIVFIPKYRKKQLYGQVRAGVREIIRTLCGYKGVEIIDGAVCPDHVHLSVSIPPKMSISTFMGYLKGKSTAEQSILGKRVLCRNNRQCERRSNQEVRAIRPLGGQSKPPFEVVVLEIDRLCRLIMLY